MNASKSETTQTSDIESALRELSLGIDAGKLNCLEDVLLRYPGLASEKDSLLELIYTEYVIRSETKGNTHADLLAEFQSRFPEHAEELQRLFQVGQAITPLIDPILSPASPNESFRLSRANDSAVPVSLGGYAILDVLGQGGMGIVYKAVQNGLDREVALKTTDAIRELDRRTIAQLTREAELASSLQHPNIVQIFEVGSEDGTPFFSMEYVSGGTLAEVVGQHSLAPEVAAKLVATIARAVGFAHGKGIVHRDLKPSNILLAPSDRPEALSLNAGRFARQHGATTGARFEPKVADFGLAIGLKDTSEHLQALGTPSYMAPEQIEARFGNVGVHTDVYALGALLYHCLAGRPPFQAPTIDETLHQVCEDEAQPLTALLRRMPKDLETICNKCLQKSPMNRYSSAHELADDLERFLTHNPIRAKAPGALVHALKWSRRHPTATTLICASLLAACAATLFGRAEAIRATQEAEARQRTEQMLYGNRIALASTELRSKDLNRCREILKQCDPALRDWEWDYLNSTASEAVFESVAKPLIANSVSLSPDGRLVAGGFGQWSKNHPQTIDVWDVQEKRLVWTLAGHPDSEVPCVRFNSDGTRLLSCAAVSGSSSTTGGVLEWDMSTGKLIRNLSAVNARVAEYSPDGQQIIVGTTRGLLQVFDASSGELIKTLRGHNSIILSLAFGPGDRFITTSRDGFVCLWSLHDGLLNRLHDMGDPREVVWHHDGRSVWIQRYSGLIQKFSLENNQLRLQTAEQGEAFSRVVASPDHMTYAQAGFGEGIQIRTLDNERLICQINGHRGTVRAIAFNARATCLASAGSDGVLRVWNLQRAPAEGTRTISSRGAVADCASHPHKHEVALAISNTPQRPSSVAGLPRFEIRQTESMKLIRSVDCHSDWLTCVRYSPSGNYLATGSADCKINVWDGQNSQPVWTFDQHQSPIVSLAFVDEQLIASLDEAGHLYVWNRHDGNVMYAQTLPTSPPQAPPLLCAMQSAAPNVLAVVTSQKDSSTVQLIHVGSQRILGQREVPFRVSSITCNDRARLLALGGSDGSCWLYNTYDFIHHQVPKAVEISKWNVSAISSLAFNPNGNRLVAAGDDEAIRLFDSRSGALLLTLDANYRYHSLTTFSNDGNTVVRFAGREYQTWQAQGPSRQNDPDWAYKMARLAADADNSAAIRFYCQQANDSTNTAEPARELLLQTSLLRIETDECDGAYEELIKHHPDSRSPYIVKYLVHRQKHNEAQRLLKSWRDPSQLEDAKFVNAMGWYAALLDADAETLDFWSQQLQHLHRVKHQASYANTLALLMVRQHKWDEGVAYASESLKLGGELAAPLDWLIQLQCLVSKASEMDKPTKAARDQLRKQTKSALAALEVWNRDRKTSVAAQSTSRFRDEVCKLDLPIVLGDLRKQVSAPALRNGFLKDLPWKTLDEVLVDQDVKPQLSGAGAPDAL